METFWADVEESFIFNYDLVMLGYGNFELYGPHFHFLPYLPLFAPCLPLLNQSKRIKFWVYNKYENCEKCHILILINMELKNFKSFDLHEKTTFHSKFPICRKIIKQKKP